MELEPGAKLIKVWKYPGDTMRVARFNMPDGSKQFRPVHSVVNGWQIGDPPGLLPLYRGDELPADGPIVVVEGEGCADLARELSLAGVTSAHGSSSPHKSDWKRLAGRDTWIFPDNDDPGEKYAQAVARIVIGLGCRVKIIRLPDLPAGGDIIDFDAAIGDTPDATRTEIERLAADVQPAIPAEISGDSALVAISAGELCSKYKELKPVVIDGVLRETETANIVAPSKVGKTHLAMDLGLCLGMGRAWLDRFPVKSCRVLYIDAELHRETISRRLAAVAKARGILSDQFADVLHILSLRGKLRSLYELAPFMAGLQKRFYGAIVIDALYRLTPEGFDENSNGSVTMLYNRLDQYAEMTGAAFICIHHASKGNQSGKSIVDIGSGAGAQSRAVDAHMVLRPHEQDGAVVLDAALRSFPPIKPLALRWDYPLWKIDSDIDPNDLREPGAKKKKPDEAAPWTPVTFVAAFIDAEPRTKAAIMLLADGKGLSERKSMLLLNGAVESGLAFKWEATDRKKPIRYANREPGLTEIRGVK